LRGKVIFRTVHAPRSLAGLPESEEVWLVSGIANPRAFERTVVSLGMKVAGHSVFPDHHCYASGDVEEVLRQAGDLKVVTTAKDGVKLEELPGAEAMIVLEIDVTFINGEETFFNLVFGPR
jgi:tetraacyldisaccharide 4'-kinase